MKLTTPIKIAMGLSAAGASVIGFMIYKKKKDAAIAAPPAADSQIPASSFVDSNVSVATPTPTLPAAIVRTASPILTPTAARAIEPAPTNTAIASDPAAMKFVEGWIRKEKARSRRASDVITTYDWAKRANPGPYAAILKYPRITVIQQAKASWNSVNGLGYLQSNLI
jgi:hypothetical protein